MGASLPKQYLKVANRTVLEWATAAILAQKSCVGLVVVLSAEDTLWTQTSLAGHPQVLTVLGGAERSDSVLFGLHALKERARTEDWVVVHDAARPCLSRADLHRLLLELAPSAVGGLLAAPLVDTLKRSDEDGNVAATLERDGLWRALTPQMFRYGVLLRALESARARGLRITDEAQAVELLGMKPKLVPGSADNLKITVPTDLETAARILARRSEDG